MRIVALGLGGAGCRIVDSLYAIDRKSSRVACVEALAADVDEASLQQLLALPDSQKLYYPPFDPMNPNAPAEGGATATIDIDEILSRIHNYETGENDAILICCGLGGQMTDIVPHVIAGLRSSIIEPIFGLVTLPCLAEGEKKTAKAADDVDILSSLLDGMIVFDNETWYKKTRPLAQARLEKKKEKGLAQMLGIGRPEPELSPEMMTYHLLNEAIVRRISLILKAGEFRADGGIDLAEVVLDSGEVLNTMKDGGFITIGYAVEHLSSNPLAFLSQFRPSGPFNEEGKKRASRIVELAKQAIYHEVSTPCDMTSAHKALILIAGPSHELSMQGFMTVRKWIDRSIRGLETRSGDYPVMNTKNVAIIVMLSGLENIPRINELREIREQIRAGPAQRAVPEHGQQEVTRVQENAGSLRDEMIVLPTQMQRVPDSPQMERVQTPAPERKSPTRPTAASPVKEILQPREPPPVRPTTPRPTTLQQIPLEKPRAAHDRSAPVQEPGKPTAPHKTFESGPEIPPRKIVTQQPLSLAGIPDHSVPAREDAPALPSHEHARQRIERELQRQRMMALSGKPAKKGSSAVPSPTEPSAAVRTKRVVVTQAPPPEIREPVSRPPREGILEASVKKTVIIRKRTRAPDNHELPERTMSRKVIPAPPEQERPLNQQLESVQVSLEEDEPVMLKEQEFRAKDTVFQGKIVTDTSVPKARDGSLIHTSLKPKKPVPQEEDAESLAERQQGKKGKKPDDISWI
ncbi:tubulin/FtsZ family protein [Methanoregula formicica]|uniref:Cell division GTPase n=1 Tax=Methanoregula formicica (strain DSM 22288 / NBRC 105244 / SMSP) TaxID=593750 RepID=L0HG02_METFS|nr:tubulin/FtsZ family protein [Methanoregula formicica]AGB03652.1 cell division GTPase [Methanoregula formicica SMSP]